MNVDRLLMKAGVEKHKIDGIAVSVGPGSFTGLRIGISSAIGLSSALGVPCTGVPLFDAFAASVNAGERIVFAVPLGRSDVGYQLFENSALTGAPRSGGRDELAAFIRQKKSISIAFHTSLAPLAGELASGLSRHDLGSNMADYLAPFAATHPAGSLDPIYVQNPRFSQGL